jgi:hypothetical protein
MELLKKNIKRALELVANPDGTHTFVPRTDVQYHMKIGLTTDNKELGFFYAEEPLTLLSITGNTDVSITGTTISRLIELKKYTASTVFTNLYIVYDITTGNGVDYTNSIENVLVVYYIDGIMYIDDLINKITTYSYIGIGYASPDFIFYPVLKDDLLNNIVTNVNVSSDIYIERSPLSVYDMLYRLEHIENMLELNTYAGGGVFVVVNNI